VGDFAFAPRIYEDETGVTFYYNYEGRFIETFRRFQ
jgi:hypothetical protein